MRAFDYVSPDSIDEVLGLLAAHPDGGQAVRPLAGGTDLLTLMKADLVAPETLVDVKRLAELDDRIAVAGGALEIGALATLAEIETNPLVRATCPALAEAAAVAATPQLRHMATIGGNLLQRPRCWYFRNPRVRCWLKGGDQCFARGGENAQHALFDVSPCVAVHPSDLAPVLLAHDAEVRLRRRDGERALPVAEFFAPPTDDRRTETVVAPDELVVSVRAPSLPAGSGSAYLKAMDRKAWAFALVGVAAALRIDGGTIAEARLALGGVAPIPLRARAAEQALVGAAPDEAAFARAARAALEEAQPLRDNGYKIPLAAVLIRRALAACLQPDALEPAAD